MMRIELVQGDIALEDTDAIVNVEPDSPVMRAAGPRLLAAHKQLRATLYPKGIPLGIAAVTPGFELHAKYVVHVSGLTCSPKDREQESVLVARALRSCLDAADSRGMRSLALPAMSTIARGLPPRDAAHILRAVLASYRPKSLQVLRLALPAAEEYLTIRSELGSLFD